MHRRELTTFFVLVFVWIWCVAAFVFLLPEQSARVFGPMSSTNPLFLLAVWGPNIVAVALTAAWSGWAGVRTLVAKFTIWRVPLRWYVLLLVGFPLLGAAAAALGGTLPSAPIFDRAPGSLARMGSMLWMLLITGALGEELGWRGFALPRLLARRSPLVSSLSLGILWGLWHLPSFLASGTPQSGTSLPAFILGAVGLSTLATWVFSKTRGSVWMAALLHFMANLALNVLSAPMTYFAALLAAVCLVVVLNRLQWWLASPGEEQASEVQHVQAH